MVCSATVVEDPAHPGKSNLVWTAGHCVHAGKKGGWYRNIVFVPSYNDAGKTAAAAAERRRGREVAPYGVWWARLGADLRPVDRRRAARPAVTGASVRLRGAARDAGEGRPASRWRRRSVRRCRCDFDAPAVPQGRARIAATRLPGRAALRRC